MWFFYILCDEMESMHKTLCCSRYCGCLEESTFVIDFPAEVSTCLWNTFYLKE